VRASLVHAARPPTAGSDAAGESIARSALAGGAGSGTKAAVSAWPQILPAGLWYSLLAPVTESLTVIQYSTSESAP
jgi:hypothetical protein